MEYAIGFIAGVAVSILNLLILTFFRSRIERKVTVIETQIANAGPRPKGFIVEPEDDADEIRRDVIEKNRRAGRDTKLSELQ